MYKEWWSTLEGCILWSCLQGMFLPSETLPYHFSSLCLSSVCALLPCPVPAIRDVVLCLPLPQQCVYLHLPWNQVCMQSLASSFPCFSSLFPQDLPLSVLHSLTLFSKFLRSSLYPLISCFPGSSPSLGNSCSFHIHPVILATIPPSLMPPSHPAFFLSLRSWTELCLEYAGFLELVGGDVSTVQRDATKHQAVLGALWPLTVLQSSFFLVLLVCCCHMEMADGVDQEVNLEAYPFHAVHEGFVH